MGPTTQIAKKKIELGNPQPTGAPVDKPIDLSQEIKKDEQKKPRTRGLWLFDAVLYNLVNLVVFAVSVYATYLTTNGGNRIAKDGTILNANNKEGIQYTDADGKLQHGWLGSVIHARGNWLMNKFENGFFKMSHGQADMAKMVFFSFADGTLVAPLVKLLEDRREKIAYSLDKMMGTVPEDKSVYAAEPKQSWTSVIMGRLATVSIVVPTAVVLEKIGSKNGAWKGEWTHNLDKKNAHPEGKNLNDLLFNDQGYKYGEKVAAKPNKAKYFGKLDIPYLFKTVYFEAFYTTVCTIGLYFSSRLIAAFGKDKKNAIPKDITTEPTTSTLPTTHSVTVHAEKEPASEKKFASDKLKSASPTTAENFTERSKAPAESSAFVSA